MFREYLGPSSGGTTVYIQQLVLIILFRWMSKRYNSHLNRILSTNCFIHTVYHLMMGLDTPETCRGWRNILRISCASSWFFLTRRFSVYFSCYGYANAHKVFRSASIFCILWAIGNRKWVLTSLYRWKQQAVVPVSRLNYEPNATQSQFRDLNPQSACSVYPNWVLIPYSLYFLPVPNVRERKQL
jgi:hypothetical protein